MSRLFFWKIKPQYVPYQCLYCTDTSTHFCLVLRLSDRPCNCNDISESQWFGAALWVQVIYSKIYPRALFEHSHMKNGTLDSYYSSQWMNVVKQWHLHIPGILQTASSRQANWCPLYAIIAWNPVIFWSSQRATATAAEFQNILQGQKWHLSIKISSWLLKQTYSFYYFALGELYGFLRHKIS